MDGQNFSSILINVVNDTKKVRKLIMKVYMKYKKENTKIAINCLLERKLHNSM